MSLFSELERIILVTGHYGSGKTNLSVNLALKLQEAGRQVVLCDLDIVNPYFRSADFERLMHEKGIGTISPTFANTNLDLPSLGGGLSALLRTGDKTIIVDVGGDDAGATALGRYAPDIQRGAYTMLYVYNHYRYLTQEAADALEVLNAIKAVSRLECTHIVNNSNLSYETSAEDIEHAIAPCQELSRIARLPVLFTTVPRAVYPAFEGREGFLPIEVYVKKPWE